MSKTVGDPFVLGNTEHIRAPGEPIPPVGNRASKVKLPPNAKVGDVVQGTSGKHRVVSVGKVQSGSVIPPDTNSLVRTMVREHRAAVERAISEGRPVPPEVLADYPDLQPKPPGGETKATAETTPKWGVYPTEVAGRGTMFAVRESDNPKGFGDTIHPSREAAEKFAAEAKDRDERNTKSRKEAADLAAAKTASEAAKKAERDDVGGFADDLPPLRKGKVLKDLDALVRVGGVADTTKNHVKRMVAEGAELSETQEPKVKPPTRTAWNRMDQRQQDAHEKRAKEAGNVTVYRIGGYNLGKTAYEYAKFLKANTKAQAPFESKGPETIKAPDMGRAYPLEDPPSYGDSDYKSRGGAIENMTPDEFLSRTLRPLKIDEASRDNIDDLKRHIESGRKLDPPTLYTSVGKVVDHDGRHRAIAAKELGIKTIPVLTIPKDAGRAGSPPDGVEAPAGVGVSSAMKRRGLKGDALANAMDRIGELRDNGAQVDDDGYVTLYHRTTPEKADAIRKSGMMRGEEDGLFFSTSKTGQADGFGDAIVVVREPVERVELDDVFGNEAHVRIPLKRAGQSVRVGVVSDPSTATEVKGTPTPKDMAALKAKYPAVDFKFIKGVITPGAAYMTPKALAEWRNTASGVPFKDQIALLDARLGKAAKPEAAETAKPDGATKPTAEGLIARSGDIRAKIATEMEKRAGYAMWIDHQLITPDGKFEFVDGRLRRVQDLSMVGFRKNLMDMMDAADGEGKWWGANDSAKRMAEEYKAKQAKLDEVEAEGRRKESDRVKRDSDIAAFARARADEALASAKFVTKEVSFPILSDGKKVDKAIKGPVLSGLLVHKSFYGKGYDVSHIASGKRINQTQFSNQNTAKLFAARISRVADFTKGESDLMKQVASEVYKDEISPMRFDPYSVTHSDRIAFEAKERGDAEPPKSRADKIVDTANKIADEAKKRRQERTITRANKPGERGGGSPLIPDAIDFGIEIAARAVAKGITGGQALGKHISAALKTLPEELKPYGGRVRYVARRVVLGATKNGVFQPSLMADSIQTERLRHAENDETVKARQKLHKIVGGTDKAKAEPKLRQEIDANLGVRKAPTYTVGGPVDLEQLLPEHRYAIATLYTSVKRGKAISGTNEAAEFINAQTEKGLANLFTPEMLAELRGLEGRGAKGGMTPDQMELIATAIQHVAHLSKTQRTATVLGQIRQLDEDGGTVVGELTGRVNVPKQGLIDRAMGRAEKEPNPGIVRRFLVRAQDSLGDMLHVAFGDGVMKKYGYEAIAKAEGAKRLEYAKADAKLREVLTRHKVKAEDVGKATKNPTTFNLPNAGEVKIPAMEALDVVLAAGDQQNTALLVKNGVVSKRFQGQGEKKIDITEADIEALGQQLPAWVMDFGRTGVEIINGYTDQVNATSVAIDGVEIAQKRTGSDYYYPRTPDPVLRTAGVRQDEMMELAWAERLGFTKKRTGASVPYQIKPAIERIMDHIDGATTYIHMAEPTLNVRKLIARPEVLENIQKRLGSAWRKAMLRRLNEAQGMIPPPESDIQQAGRWLLRNTARTSLWGRLSSAMAQTAGVPMLMNRMTGKERAHFLKHLAKLDWVKNPTVMREMTGESGYFADRYPETGEQTRLGTGIDLESSLPSTAMGRWYQEALRVGFKPMEYGDKVLSALAYMAAKDAGHPDPVFRAEMLIRQSQNATSPMDRSGMMLEGEKNALVGALALFSSAPNRVRGQIRADLSDVRANPKNGKAWARLAATALAAGIAAVMGESIRELWRRQKVGFTPEDKPRTRTDHLVNTLATLGDSIVPKGGQILRGAINGVRGKVSQTFDAPGMDLADSLGNLLGHLDNDEEKAKRLGPNIDKALRALSAFMGVVGEPVYDLGVGISRTFDPPATVAAYSAAVRRNDYEEAKRIAAELRKANPKIDLKARRKNYEERVGLRGKKQ